MPLKLKGDTLADYIYDKFPSVYKKEDLDNELYLQRYIQSQGVAFADIIPTIDGIIDALDPAKCPSELFPTLYECFGLPYFQDIPEAYQRKILSLIGELYIRKGTKGALTFLAKEVTKFDAEIVEVDNFYFKTWSPDFPQTPSYVPSKTNPEMTSDKDIKLMDFKNVGNTRTSNSREVIIKLTAPDEDSTLDIRELVFKKFLFYFLPFDIYWSMLTNYFYAEDVVLDIDEAEFDSLTEVMHEGTNDMFSEVVAPDRIILHSDETYTFAHGGVLNNSVHVLNSNIVTNRFVDIDSMIVLKS